MVIGRISYLRVDGECIVGEENYGTIAMLVVDVLVNCHLTSLFLLPLYRSGKHAQSISTRNLTRRTCAAAIFALITSFANIVVLLAVFQGAELSFVCLGSCSLDISLNATILFCVRIFPFSSHN